MDNRLIPDTWFRAQTRSTTMSFLMAKHQGRDTPLGEGERQLGWFVLPPFQRPPVWSLAQQESFIESCWLGLPIGAFVVNRTTSDGPFDNWLIDGQQRVTAVLSYIADEFPVFGHKFSELTVVDHRMWIMSVAFPCLETNIEDEDALFDVYTRLAYGGTPHALPNQPREEE